MRKVSSTSKLLGVAEVNPFGIIYEEKTSAPHMLKGSRTWTMKEAPVVSGATVQQLVVWLTYHRAIDSEFADTFLHTFTSFMTPEHLLTSLISRFNISPPHQLNETEREAFQTDIVIPIRLRVVHALHVWITRSYDDFKEGHAPQSLLDKFLNTIEISLPTCAQQLRKALAKNVKLGPAHLHTGPHGKPPSSLTPPDITSNTSSFDLLDVNSLELARQLTLSFSYLLRDIRPHELLSRGWREETTIHLCPHITYFQQMTSAVSELVSREVVRETLEEDQSSVISYFIETAKSCRELKNFAGVSAIMDGLSQTSVQEQESAWQLVTEHLLRIYRELQGLVSPDDSHHRYRQDVRVIHQSPVVPDLGILLSDMEEIDETHADFLPEPQQAVVNFSKRRLQAKLVRQLQRHQSLPYNLTPVEIMQKYIRDLLEHSSEGHR
jgi:son of sevenless-like protein